MQRIAAALVVLIASAGWPGLLRAERPGRPGPGNPPFELSAETLEYESRGEIYVARGSVVLRQGDETVRADWMMFSAVTRRGVASGNVVYSDGTDTVHTSFAEFNVDTLQGVLFDARFASSGDQFRLEGAEIVKTGEDTYTFEEGMFTTCRCPTEGRDPWRLRAASADVEVDGYATARNTTFDVLGVPVVWLPWMIYPLKTERQSGFLLPEVAIGSRNGVDVGLPFFWAVADPVNATLTPRWLEKRGFKGDAELEFVWGEHSWGEVFGSYLHDEDIDPHSPSEPYGRDRWAVSGRQDAFLPGEIRARADFAFVSDNDYVIDFDELSEHRSDRFLEATSWGGRTWGGAGALGLVASTAWANDLQNPDDLDRDRFLLQRLPHVELTWAPTPLRGASILAPALEVDYTYFTGLESAGSQLSTAAVVGDGVFLDTGIDGLPDSRERGPGGGPQGGAVPGADPDGDNFDPATGGGPEGNGRFEEGEPLGDRGHRLVLTPRLGLPLRLGDAVEIYPEAGWVQTLYYTDAQEFVQRGQFIGRADLRTRLERRFGGGTRHVVEPRLGYAFVTGDGQRGNPLFVPETAVPQTRVRQLDLENVVLDPSDRIDRFNGTTWGVANRWFGAAAEGAAPRLLADVELLSAYDFEEGGFGWLVLDGRAYPWRRTSARFDVAFDPEDARLEEVLSEITWLHDAGHQVAVTYRYLRRIPRFYEDFQFDSNRFDQFESDFDRVNQIGLALRVAFTRQWAAFYRVAYAFEQSLLLGNAGGIEYTSRCRCWALAVEIAQDRVRDVQFNVVASLLGLGRRQAARLGGVGPLP